DQLSPDVAELRGRRAPPRATVGWEIAGHTSLAAADVPVADLDAITHPALPRDDDVIACSRGAGETCLRRNAGVLTDHHVASDLRARFNDGERLNRCGRINHRIARDDRAWMNTRREADRLRRELQNNLLECLRWMRDADLRWRDRLREINRHKRSRRIRLAQL